MLKEYVGQYLPPWLSVLGLTFGTVLNHVPEGFIKQKLVELIRKGVIDPNQEIDFVNNALNISELFPESFTMTEVEEALKMFASRSFHGSSYVGAVGRKLVYGNKNKLKNAKYPIVDKIEMSGTATDPHVVYISIGPNISRIVTGLCRTLIYGLLNEGGFDITNLDINNQRALRIITYFHDKIDDVSPTVMKSFNSDSTAGESLEDLAAQWLTDLRTAQTNNVQCEIVKIQLFDFDGVNINAFLSEVDPKKVYLKVISKYTLLVQNQTAGAAPGDDQVTDVTNNPLHCTMFDCQGNMWISKQRSENTGTAKPATFKPFIHQGATNYKDLIVRTAAAQWTTPQYQSGQIFQNSKSSYGFTLNPGQMKKTGITHVNCHTFASWFKEFYFYFLQSSPSFHRVKYGGSRLISFDKMINTGEDVIVSYELNLKNTYGYRLNKKKVVMPKFYSESI